MKRTIAVSGARTIVLVLGILGTGCGDGLGPASELSVYLSLSEGLVALGDTVELGAVAHNGGNADISAGVTCGPGITVLVVDPAGAETDLRSGRLWTCPLRDSNRLEPGETDVVTWHWTPPDTGSYSLRAAVTMDGGLSVESAPASVRVIIP